MNPLWFLRMARWAHRPPSPLRVKIYLAAAALCLILVGIEHFWGWPAWLTVNGRPHLTKP